MEERINIFFMNKHVGTIKSPESDMWYFFGQYFPEKSEFADCFNSLMSVQDIKANIINFEGKYIQWCTGASKKKQNGLALGIDNKGIFNFRVITNDKVLKNIQNDERYR